MPRVIHYDEASTAITAIVNDLLGLPWLARAAIIDDLFGTFRLAFWLRTAGDNERLDAKWPAIEQRLVEACAGFWTGRRLITNETTPSPDHDICQQAWDAGTRLPDASERLRYVDRHRSRTSWFMPLRAPSQAAPTDLQAIAPVIAFYSFKGGMGRTTAAAAYALRQAKAGRRVVAIDLDLDAPGLGRLLGTEAGDMPNPWGTVDFLLEHRLAYPMTEYRHVCARAELVGEQPIDVFPVGKIDELYLRKLAKIDLDLRDDEVVENHPVGILLARIRAELKPDLIIADCRAGLSPISGFMLSPLADVHVVFSTASDQALDGLRRIVHRLGADRLQAGLPQGECVLVQAMLPGSSSGGEAARSFFDARVEDIFSFHYYERPTGDPATRSSDDATWLLDDLELPDAPHHAIAVPYRERLADFRDLKDILDIMDEAPYRAISARIDARLSGRGAAKPDPEDV